MTDFQKLGIKEKREAVKELLDEAYWNYAVYNLHIENIIGEYAHACDVADAIQTLVHSKLFPPKA